MLLLVWCSFQVRIFEAEENGMSRTRLEESQLKSVGLVALSRWRLLLKLWVGYCGWINETHLGPCRAWPSGAPRFPVLVQLKWPPFSNRRKSKEPRDSPGSLVLLFSSSSPLLSFTPFASTFPPSWPLYPLSWFFTVSSPALSAKPWATDTLQGRRETGKGKLFPSRCSPSSWRDGRRVRRELETTSGLPGGSDGKESACNAGDPGLIPGSGRSPEGIGTPLQYSYLENPLDRADCGLQSMGSQGQTRLSD